MGPVAYFGVFDTWHLTTGPLCQHTPRGLVSRFRRLRKADDGSQIWLLLRSLLSESGMGVIRVKQSHRDLRLEYDRLQKRIGRYKINTPQRRELSARSLRVSRAIEKSRVLENREIVKLEQAVKKLRA